MCRYQMHMLNSSSRAARRIVGWLPKVPSHRG
jgi:hypothetical protein